MRRRGVLALALGAGVVLALLGVALLHREELNLRYACWRVASGGEAARAAAFDSLERLGPQGWEAIEEIAFDSQPVVRGSWHALVRSEAIERLWKHETKRSEPSPRTAPR